MRRVAAHWLFLPDGGKMHLPVVELEDAVVLNYYPIEEELPLTEWLGGVLVLSPVKELNVEKNSSWEEVLRKLHPFKTLTYPLYCWTVTGIELETGEFTAEHGCALLREEE